jgi:hypothetical protein
VLHVALFVLIMLFGFLGAVAIHPAFSFMLYELIFFFNPPDRWWAGMVPGLSYSFLSVVLMLVLGALNLNKGPNPFKSGVFILIYLYFSLFLLANLYAVFPDLHFKVVKEYLTLIVVITLAYKLCTSEKILDYYIFAYVFGAWYIGFLTFQIGRNSGDRVEGIGTPESTDGNFTAASLAPSLVFAFYYFWMSKDWKVRIFIAVLGVFILNALVLINSRGAFLGLVVGFSYFFAYMYFSKVGNTGQKMAVIGFVILGLSGLVYVADKSFIERITGVSQVEMREDQTSGATRVFYWIAAWDMAKDYPFGKGVQSFFYYSPVYIPEDVKVASTNTGTRNRSVHSSWFEILTEVGYLGWLIYGVLIYHSFRAMRRCRQVLCDGGDRVRYFKVVAIQGAIIVFLFAMTFINRSRGEVLHWLFMFSALSYNLYFTRRVQDELPDSAGNQN